MEILIQQMESTLWLAENRGRDFEEGQTGG